MPDPARVRPDQPLSIPAEDFNEFVGATRRDRASLGPRPSFDAGALSGGYRAGDVALVQNDTVTTLARQSVVAVLGPHSGALVTPDNLSDFIGSPGFSARKPAEDTGGMFAVTLDPLSASAVGRAVVSGLVAVQIEVTDVTHRFAVTAVNETSKLISSDFRWGAEIWHVETGLGLKWAVVRLPGGCQYPPGAGPIFLLAASSPYTPLDMTAVNAVPHYDVSGLDLFAVYADGPVTVRGVKRAGVLGDRVLFFGMTSSYQVAPVTFEHMNASVGINEQMSFHDGGRSGSANGLDVVLRSGEALLLVKAQGQYDAPGGTSVTGSPVPHGWFGRKLCLGYNDQIFGFYATSDDIARSHVLGTLDGRLRALAWTDLVANLETAMGLSYMGGLTGTYP